MSSINAAQSVSSSRYVESRTRPERDVAPPFVELEKFDEDISLLDAAIAELIGRMAPYRDTQAVAELRQGEVARPAEERYASNLELRIGTCRERVVELRSRLLDCLSELRL